MVWFSWFICLTGEGLSKAEISNTLVFLSNTNNLYTMVSSNYSYLIKIVSLHTVIWFKVFKNLVYLSKTILNHQELFTAEL